MQKIADARAMLDTSTVMAYVLLVIVFVSLFEYLITKPLENPVLCVEKIMLSFKRNVRFLKISPRSSSCAISVWIYNQAK